MVSLELLHASYESVAAFDGLSVVARCTEAAYRAVTLHADHALGSSEVEEVLLQLCVLVGHDEAEVHDRTVLFDGCATEHLVAVNLTIDNLCTLLSQLVHSCYAAVLLNPAQGLQS